MYRNIIMVFSGTDIYMEIYSFPLKIIVQSEPEIQLFCNQIEGSKMVFQFWFLLGSVFVYF